MSSNIQIAVEGSAKSGDRMSADIKKMGAVAKKVAWISVCLFALYLIWDYYSSREENAYTETVEAARLQKMPTVDPNSIATFPTITLRGKETVVVVGDVVRKVSIPDEMCIIYTEKPDLITTFGRKGLGDTTFATFKARWPGYEEHVKITLLPEGSCKL